MKINIYTKRNGVGLEADANILHDILQPQHDVKIIDWDSPGGNKRPANVAIHLEHIRKELLHLAPYNINIPNPEWFEPNWIPLLKRVNLVLCKTHYTQSIFEKIHGNTVYTSFTSRDMYKPEATKHRMFFHLSGRSKHKGSEAVRNVWKANHQLPLLIMHRLENLAGYIFEQENYYPSVRKVKDIRDYMNMAVFHLCPSKAEGFGHYINEALSAGSIVITTDAPCMNELIDNSCGFVVPAVRCGRHHLSDEFCVNEMELFRTINKVCQLTDEQINVMSANARALYLKRDTEFKQTFLNVINNI